MNFVSSMNMLLLLFPSILILVGGSRGSTASAFVLQPLPHQQRRISHVAINPFVLKAFPVLSSPANATSSFDVTNIRDEDDLWEQKERLNAFFQLQLEQEIDAKPSLETTSVLATTTSSAPSLVVSRDVWNARFLLIGAAALYGTNFSFVKLLGDIMPVGVSSTLRFGLAALATLPWLLMQNKIDDIGNESNRNDNAFKAAAAGFEVGMWNSVGYIAQAVGLATTDASKSAFLCSLAVVVVPLLDFMFGKKLLPREIAGVVMAVLGVAALELGGGAASGFSLTNDELCSLVQPLAFGMGFWKMEKAMRKYPEEANRSTAAQLLAVFLASAAYAGVVGIPEMDVIVGWIHEPQILLALFWTGCITTALTVYMETLALKTLSAAETTLIFSTEPLWGAACASFVMGEQLGLGTFAGGALILGGCVVSNLGVQGIFGKGNEEWLPSLAAQWTGGIMGGLAAVPVFAMEDETIEEVVEEVIQKAVDSL